MWGSPPKFLSRTPHCHTRLPHTATSLHYQLLTETENQYEHKLAVQVDRFDRLSEDTEVLKQRCEGLMVMERKDAEKQINDLKLEARNREKRYCCVSNLRDV